ncbi:lipid transferase CIDEB [Paroedura picta]|uniref:lipid transferase CIDEB n=1 Tax=Paroedura picta TaxID=143630 RepID=UPI004056E3AF
MEYLNSLAPSALLKSVSSAGSGLTRRVWAPSPPPQRPFRVCDHKRNVRKGLTASSLKELLTKAMETLTLYGAVSLVLDEDGTAVESEEFFQVLEDNTTLMLLRKDQKWSPGKGSNRSYALSREKPRNSRDIARITFDVYKLNPRDLFGSLNVSATFYGLYSMSCDFKCLGPKKVLREVLRVVSGIMQGIGHILLGASHYIRHLLEGGENWHSNRRLQNYED